MRNVLDWWNFLKWLFWKGFMVYWFLNRTNQGFSLVQISDGRGACGLCSFIAHLCQVSTDLIYFSPLKFFVGSLHPAWSLFLNCSYFLGNMSLSVLINCVLIKKHVQKNNAQLISWWFLMIQSVSFTSAAFKIFAEAYLCLSKKMPRIVKSTSSRTKYIFV